MIHMFVIMTSGRQSTIAVKSVDSGPECWTLDSYRSNSSSGFAICWCKLSALGPQTNFYS